MVTQQELTLKQLYRVIIYSGTCWCVMCNVWSLVLIRRIPLASPGLIHAHFGDLVGLYTDGLIYRRKIMAVTSFWTCEEKETGAGKMR